MSVLAFDLYFPSMDDLWDRTGPLPDEIVFPAGRWGAMALWYAFDHDAVYEPIDAPLESAE